MTPDDLIDAEAALAVEDMPDLTEGQIRVWATRGKVGRYGYTKVNGKRRTLYSLTEIRKAYFGVSSTSSQRVV